MNARRGKTPESELGAKMRVFAKAYAGHGQEERARAYANAADTVDEYMHVVAVGAPALQGLIDALTQIVRQLSGLTGEMSKAFDAMGTLQGDHPVITSEKPRLARVTTPLLDPIPAPGPVARAAARVKEIDGFAAQAAEADARELKPVDAALLSALVQRRKPSTWRQLATMAGYKPSGTVSSAFARLRANGWIDGPGLAIVLTDAGRIAAPPGPKLPTGEALVTYWVGELSQAAGRILRVFVDAYPRVLDMDSLLGMTGYQPSGTVSSALARLRLYELVDGWKASDDFMEMVRE
jgi:hypothetical protein